MTLLFIAAGGADDGSLRDERDAAARLALSLRDARLPTISAVIAAGNAPTRDARLPDNYSAGGIQVSVPLFAGGLYQARQREAELRARGRRGVAAGAGGGAGREPALTRAPQNARRAVSSQVLLKALNELTTFW